MPDPADHAEALEQLERETAIRNARAKATLTLPPRATCLNCDAPTKNGARWCDAECRDDYLRDRARHPKDE